MDRLVLLQGTLDLLILKLLSREALHGFGLARELKQLSDDRLLVAEGSLYPALYRMEKRGWIRSWPGASENNRRARYYELTPAGQTQLAQEEENWEQFAGMMDRVLHPAPRTTTIPGPRT